MIPVPTKAINQAAIAEIIDKSIINKEYVVHIKFQSYELPPARQRTSWRLSSILLAMLTVVLSVLSAPRPAQAATTVIRVCSHLGTSSYNILSSSAQDLRLKLDNPTNFGPNGAYGDFDFTYINVGDNFTEQTLLTNSCDIFFSGYEPDSSYTSTELAELQNWVTNNDGQVIAGCDDSGHDPVCNLLNFTVTTDTDTYGFITDTAVNPINCDGSLGTGDQLEMAGGAGGYFSGAGVTASNVLAVHETNGLPNSSKPIVIYTGNFFFTADINMITVLGLSTGNAVTNNNDILAMNAFSALADAAIGNAVCSSAAGLNLSVADANLNASSGSISVPVILNTDGASIASVGFSLDYDQTCLSFDATDANSDDIPDNITGLPVGFASSITHDAADSDGELDISLYDLSATPATLNDGALLTVAFGVNSSCVTTDGSTRDVTVNFSSAPAASFGDPTGTDVDGTTLNGTLTLKFNATPTDIALSNSSVDENVAVDTTVGALTTADTDAGDTHTYTLVAGAGADDNASFAIDGDQLKTGVAFDFETKNSYTVRVRTTDAGGLFFEKAFIIAINDLYEAPAGIDTSQPGGGDDSDPNTLDINENKPGGSTVATFAPGNPDDGSTYTYELVSGTGDTDNGSFTIVNGNELQTNGSLDAEKPGGYTIRVKITDNASNSYEQIFVITVNNINEAPLAVNDDVDPLSTVVVGAASLTIDVLANDSDPEGDAMTVTALEQPAAGSAATGGSNVSFTGPNANGTDSFTYKATDGSLESTDATVTVNYVKNDTRGDCNGNGSIGAGDFVATALEYFDSGDDPQYGGNPAWWSIYAGGYAGSPIGCDSNASQNGASNTADSVNVADIICTVRLFFGDACAPAVVVAADVQSGAAASLRVANVVASAGAAVDVPIMLHSNGDLAAAGFTLNYDAASLRFDATDADGDGLPDALALHLPAGVQAWTQVSDGQIQVALAGLSLPLPTLADGALATVTFDLLDSGSIVRLTNVSAGDTSGRDVDMKAEDGAVGVVNHSFFMPLVTK